MANEQKTYELAVQPRAVTGKKSKRLRRQGLIPGVLYGHNVNSQSVQIPLREFERVYLRAGSNTLVDLRVGEDGGPRKVFIHEVHRDPVSHTLAHVDFLAVNLREEMTASVVLTLVGEAPAATRNDGMLLQTLEHVQVRALPSDLPPVLEVDISGLEEVDQAVHVSDLIIPDNVTLLTPGEEVIAKIAALRVEPVEEEEAEEAAEEEAAEAEAETEGAEAEAEAEE